MGWEWPGARGGGVERKMEGGNTWVGLGGSRGGAGRWEYGGRQEEGGRGGVGERG